MQQIADWLQRLGLGQYAERFAENEIDVSVLPHLTDQDLKDIGVPLGPRRKILAAITAETGTTNATPEPAASIEPKAQHRRAPPSHRHVLRLGRLYGPLGPHGP